MQADNNPGAPRSLADDFRSAIDAEAFRQVSEMNLRGLRVRMSCSPLVFTKKSLAEVASEFGFADQSHFTKEFRRIMDETPSAYRRRFQPRG